MAQKGTTNQPVARRAPRQARSLYKVQLILDAALEVLEREDYAALTTNSLAARAGVSIGTIYQYFPDKQAIVDALVSRELKGMATNILEVVSLPAQNAGDRIRGLVTVILNSYRGRKRAHRQLIAHSSQRGGSRLNPLFAALEQLLGSRPGAAGVPKPLSSAEAFVLMHAIGGVLRALSSQERVPPRAEIEAALARLLAGFLQGETPRNA